MEPPDAAKHTTAPGLKGNHSFSFSWNAEAVCLGDVRIDRKMYCPLVKSNGCLPARGRCHHRGTFLRFFGRGHLPRLFNFLWNLAASVRFKYLPERDL